ncbi:MAG: hypothetical protein ACOVRM_16945 [Planctomycetaceae bacterium]|jgi:UDPglucose--hexose-1-phosphate uridylyltransferase
MVCSELRTDVLCGRQSIIAVQRSARQGAMRPDLPVTALPDPFGEGCESETPGEVFSIRERGTQPNARGWRLRVVPNRYPIPGAPEAGVDLSPVAESELFPRVPFSGGHEVVIECPDLRTRLVELTASELADVFGAWRDRVLSLSTAGVYRSVAVFRNEGFSAGASLAHCHSQILATDHVPALLQERHRRSSSYWERTGRCLVRDLLCAEQRDGRRIIRLDDELAIWCPFAARTAWHIRFLPLGGDRFIQASDVLMGVLSRAVLGLAKVLESLLGVGFPFNLTVVQPRLDEPCAFPWFVDLMPRVNRQAGWELLSDIDVIPFSPEQSAEQLRALLSEVG